MLPVLIRPFSARAIIARSDRTRTLFATPGVYMKHMPSASVVPAVRLSYTAVNINIGSVVSEPMCATFYADNYPVVREVLLPVDGLYASPRIIQGRVERGFCELRVMGTPPMPFYLHVHCKKPPSYFIRH